MKNGLQCRGVITMASQPYARFQSEEMILRDYLAADRTSLANERTLLSYIRTALAFAIGGASAIHFLSGITADSFGIILILVGLLTFAVGSWRYIWYKRRIEGVTVEKATPPGSE